MYGISVLFSSRVVSISSRTYSSGSPKKLLEILANMPKPNSERIAFAQRQRQQISKKSEKYGPSTVYLQVLGSGAKGAPNTLYLFTDQKRYMFNCGECTQRLAHEHKVKLSRLDHIFITSKTWKNIGGLPGLSLTLQDVGVPNITLHGPDGLDELYNATKRFVIMKDMNVTMAKSSPTEDFEDNVMTVKYVLLGPLDSLLGMQSQKQSPKKTKPEFTTDKQFEEFIHDDTDYYNTNKNHSQREKQKYQTLSYSERAETMKFKAEKFLKNLHKLGDSSVAYICTLKKRLGTLDLAKCVELGVKPGPMLGQLKSGKDVVLPNGNLVLSKDVKTPDDPGPVFIVLDVPDPSYLQEADFKAHFDNNVNPPENIPVLIVHYTPPQVFQHPTYTNFIAKFGPTTQHLILNAKNSCLGSEAVHRTQHKLHLLDPDIFPLLRDVSLPAVWNSQSSLPKADSPIKLKCLEELKNKIAYAQFQNIINLEGPGKETQLAQESGESLVKLDAMAGRTLTMFHLRPKRQIDRSMEPKLHVQDYIQETMNVDGFATSLDQFRRVVDGLRYHKNEVVEYPKVVFLGTGSCIPSKTRNTSAIVIHVDEARSILLDCGEGTYGQLVRFYGPKKVNAFLKTLKAVYISHLHADHHIGLIGVFQARRQAFEASPGQHHVPVYLLAPGQIVTWLNIYDQQFETIKENYTLIPNQGLLDEGNGSSSDLTAAALAAIGVESVRTCRVAHCPNAFGVAIQLNGQKITYSGDTLPCEELIALGKDSTLLIHEATMEDELADEARTKMHSTTTQAIDMGRLMNARFTVLTHFSQRYARLPRLNANILHNNHTVGIAFDNMQITMNDLELLPHMYAPLQLMFADHCVEMELKAQHRHLREKRHSSPTRTHTPKRLRNPKEPLYTDHIGNNILNCKKRQSPCRTTISAPPGAIKKTPFPNMKREIRGQTVSDMANKLPRPRSRSQSRSPSRQSNTVRGTFPVERQNTNQKIEQLTQHATQNSQNLSSLRQALWDRTVGKTMTKASIGPSIQTISLQQNTYSSYSSNARSCLSELDEEILKRLKSPQVSPRTRKNQSQSQIQYEAALSKALLKPTAIASMTVQSTKLLEYENSGYGEPLVTPINKKLIIKKEVFPSTPLRNNSKVLTAVRRPTSGAASGSDKFATQGKLSRNKTRVLNSNSDVTSDCKISALKSNRDLKASITSLTSQKLRRDNNGSKAGTSRSDLNKARDSKTTISKKVENSIQGTRNTVLPEEAVKYSNKCNQPKMSCELVEKPSEETDESCDVVRPKLMRNTSPNQLNRQTIMHSTIKHYKPQLEDIKSSYLLLNKHVQAAQIKTNIAGKTRLSTNGVLREPLPKISKPSPLNEEMRQRQLIEAKNKFSSKRFYDDSKYDRIEGLNWISWQ